MDIIISYPNFQSINFGKSLSICQRLFAIFMWKDIIMLSVPMYKTDYELGTPSTGTGIHHERSHS